MGRGFQQKEQLCKGPEVQASWNAMTLNWRTRGQRSKGKGSMQISRPFKDFAFYSKLKANSFQNFEGWSGMFSKDMRFCNT